MDIEIKNQAGEYELVTPEIVAHVLWVLRLLMIFTKADNQPPPECVYTIRDLMLAGF